MTYAQLLADLLDRQNQLNIVAAGEDWATRQLTWPRYIWLECAELLDHCDIYHWKTKVEDRDQILLELVDILHFGLSDIYAKHQHDMVDTFKEPQVGDFQFRQCVENVASVALIQGAFSMPWFLAALKAYGTSLAEIYGIYVGKSTLNRFRQDFGYKTGTYLRTFDGKDDNVHLAEILSGMSECPNVESYIYQALKDRYLGSQEFRDAS